MREFLGDREVLEDRDVCGDREVAGEGFSWATSFDSFLGEGTVDISIIVIIAI